MRGVASSSEFGLSATRSAEESLRPPTTPEPTER